MNMVKKNLLNPDVQEQKVNNYPQKEILQKIKEIYNIILS